MATYKINSTGNVIIADEAFVEANYPNDYTLIPELPPDPKIAIFAQLAEIDAQSESPRAKREAALGNVAWLASLDAQAAALRAQLKAL